MGSEWFERDSDYILLEGQSTEELQSPLNRSTRLKYNCVSVSNKLVAFGSNTGGIYIFSRADQKLLQIAFAEKETNSVSLVKISPHEKYVAFVSSSNIYVLDLKLESRSKAETLRSSSDLAGCLVTSLLWDQTSAKLYIGDDLGKVSMMPVYSNKAKNLFSLPLEVIMKLDSAVVQLDKAEDKVLVSTMTRCYLCDTIKQQYSQIGKKLRDGSFGACFLRQGTSAPMIYSARPGSRIWEVDFEGNVLNTHQFKQLLAIPPSHIIHLDQKYRYETESEASKAQSVAFPKLTILRKNFLLTWTTSSLYVLDPINVKVMLWTNQFTGIQDICCLGEEIYIFFESMKVQCISFRSVTSVIPHFIQSNDIESAAHLCIYHRNVFLYKHVRKKFGTGKLQKIYDKLLEEKMQELADQIHEVIVNVQNKLADDSEVDESSSGRSRSGSAISGTSLGNMPNTGLNRAVNGTNDLLSETNAVLKDITKNTQRDSDNQYRTPEGMSCEVDSIEETVHKRSNEEQKSKNRVNDEIVQMSERGHESKNNFVDNEKAPVVYRNNFIDHLEGNMIVEGMTEDFEKSLQEVDTGTTKAVKETDHLSVNAANQSVPIVSVSESPVAMVTDNVDVLENDDDIGYLPVVNQGPRRLSLTSLSSVESGDIHLDQLFPNDFDEASDTIAVPVKRKSGKKKIRRRHSTVETGHAKSEERGTRSRSVGTPEGRDREVSPQGSVRSLMEEDSISLYSNDSILMEETTGSGKDTPDGPNINKSTEVLSVGSPSSISGEFTQSGEFTASADYLQNEEYSPRERNLSRSWEKGRSSSVPRTALQQFRNKMQTKVTVGTKNLIRNIKEKNLLTKAKELAENLSQGSDVYLNSGDVMYNDNPDILMTNPEFGPDFRDVQDQLAAQSDNTENVDATEKAIVDCQELEQITIKTKETLRDLEILTNPEAVYTVLLVWITVLNKTFQKFHLMKYKDLESVSIEETGSKAVDSNMVVNEKNCEADQNDHSGEVSEIDPLRIDSDVQGDLEKIKNETSELECLRNSDAVIKILSDKDFCYLTDPLHLSADLYRDVSELAQACFDIGCHGDILKFIELKFCDTANQEKSVDAPNKENIDSELNETDDIMKKMDDENGENLENMHNSNVDDKTDIEVVKTEAEKAAVGNERNECNKNNNSECNHGEKTGELPKSECDANKERDKANTTSVTDTVEMQEKAMSFFVRCYFPYLNVGRIREETINGKSCFSLWYALVTCMEGKSRYDGEKYGIDDKSILQHLLNNEAGPAQGAMLLGHISNLFHTKLDSVVDVCVRCHPSVHAVDVMYMCKYHQVTMETVFKQYMDLVTLNGTSEIRKQVLTDISNHKEACALFLEMLLCEDDSTSAAMDENGCPRCMGHKVKRKNEFLIDQLTCGIQEAMDQQKVLEILRKHGYWVGVLKLLKKLGPRSDHLALVLQLRDIDLLNGHYEFGYEPDSLCDWQRVLAIFEKICETGNQYTQEVSRDWSKLITWNNLAILLVRHVGSEEAISLLEEHNLPEGVLSHEFYQVCLLSGMVQKQQRSVLHSMLEKVDSYLWSNRPTVLNPQVHYLAVAEKKTHAGESTSTDLIHSMASIIKERKMSETSVEDPDCHWGIENKINILCPCCSVSLKETVSHDEPGVLIFRCGHGFHKFCLPKKECLFCDDATRTKTSEKVFYI